MEVRKWHTAHSLPVCFCLSCLCVFLSIYFSPLLHSVSTPTRGDCTTAPYLKWRDLRPTYLLKGLRSMCHPAGVRDYPPSDSKCPPQSKECSPLKAIIKQSSCLFIWSLNPDIINTRTQLSQAGVHVSKLLVTSLFLEILHGMDFGVVRWRSLSDMHKYTRKWYFARPSVLSQALACI